MTTCHARQGGLCACALLEKGVFTLEAVGVCGPYPCRCGDSAATGRRIGGGGAQVPDMRVVCCLVYGLGSMLGGAGLCCGDAGSGMRVGGPAFNAKHAMAVNSD